MSEVIEEYIRRNTGMREEEAFQSFLQQDRIKAWVGTDEGRKDRLRREFTRVWQTLHPPMTTGRPAAERSRPQPVEPVAVEVRRPTPAAAPAPAAPAPPVAHAGPAKKLQVLCPTCGKLDVILQGGVISCRTCSHRYENMLELIPVKPVGPFSFLFGEGWKGAAVAVGIVAALLALYGVLRWV